MGRHSRAELNERKGRVEAAEAKAEEATAHAERAARQAADAAVRVEEISVAAMEMKAKYKKIAEAAEERAMSAEATAAAAELARRSERQRADVAEAARAAAATASAEAQARCDAAMSRARLEKELRLSAQDAAHRAEKAAAEAKGEAAALQIGWASIHADVAQAKLSLQQATQRADALARDLAVEQRKSCRAEAALQDALPEKRRIQAFVAERTACRQKRDFANADRLRKELLDVGVVVDDKAGTWRGPGGMSGHLPAASGKRGWSCPAADALVSVPTAKPAESAEAAAAGGSWRGPSSACEKAWLPPSTTLQRMEPQPGTPVPALKHRRLTPRKPRLDSSVVFASMHTRATFARDAPPDAPPLRLVEEFAREDGRGSALRADASGSEAWQQTCDRCGQRVLHELGELEDVEGRSPFARHSWICWMCRANRSGLASAP